MSVADQIESALTQALQPVRLDVADQSHLHAGHMGARPEGETHFHVTIVSASFEGQVRVARHRMVNKALADLLVDRVHALQLTTLTPAEDAA
jgi:BolA family transcriptional regulator, general stress-responsive regulator